MLYTPVSNVFVYMGVRKVPALAYFRFVTTYCFQYASVCFR